MRRELRFGDNGPLAHATELGSTVPVFVFDSTILDALEDRDDRRVTFIADNLLELSERLTSFNSQLIVLYGDPVIEIPRLAAELGVELVVAAHDHEPYALQRDEAVRKALTQNGQRLIQVHDTDVLPPGRVMSKVGDPLTVFTPFKKAWLEAVTDADLAAPQVNVSNLVRTEIGSEIDLVRAGFTRNSTPYPAGELEASRTLATFLSGPIDTYAERRDFPAVDGTSELSPHFRFGTISYRRALSEAIRSTSPGAEKWRDELIWREFYRHILFHFPHAVSGAFKKELNDIDWPGEVAHFEAWKAGQTGYPIVDAGMRCLAATGTLHNRLRMVVASFLVKDLLINWQWGETHFARYLMDFELSSNNGGWQWCASTGCDAQPYFRIFNPLLQSLKFDEKGDFIRRWCPELSQFEGRLIHEPHLASAFDQAAAGCVIGTDYPEPIVNHHDQKPKVLHLFKQPAPVE